MDNKTAISRRNTLKGGVALGLVGSSPLFSSALAAGVYQWGSSSLGSTGYLIISVLAATANQYTKLRNSSLSTSGASENMVLLGQETVQFAQTTSADFQPAAEGKGQFAGNPVHVSQMFAFTVWQLQPMVHADSGINSIADLAGKRVMPVTGGGTTHIMWRDTFEAAGIPESKIKWSFGSWNQCYDALRSGATDCVPILLTNGRSSAQVTQLEASGLDMKVLDFPEALAKQVQQKNPGILRTVIEPGAGTTRYIKTPTAMISLGGILGVSPKVPEDDCYTILEAIMKHLDYVKSKGKELQDIDLQFGVANLMTGYPVHPGAARYFKEKGVWRPELKIG